MPCFSTENHIFLDGQSKKKILDNEKSSKPYPPPFESQILCLLACSSVDWQLSEQDDIFDQSGDRPKEISRGLTSACFPAFCTFHQKHKCTWVPSPHPQGTWVSEKTEATETKLLFNHTQSNLDTHVNYPVNRKTWYRHKMYAKERRGIHFCFVNEWRKYWHSSLLKAILRLARTHAKCKEN